jgi:hypothetical protein
MVVPVAVPSTSTLSPFVTALAEVGLVPFSYFVEGVSLTVTAAPADVEIVKLEVDLLPTVPDAPPAAGPERALVAPPGAGPVDLANGNPAGVVLEPLLAAALTRP